MSDHDQARATLAFVFGDDWERSLAAEGILLGDDASVALSLAALIEHARQVHPSIPPDELMRSVGRALSVLWLDSHVAASEAISAVR
jgi:hypothetical protein